MRKRGISEVVTSLIIILFVLVAVGIVWVVINNIIKGGTEEITIQPFTERIKIESAKLVDGAAHLRIKRTSGEADMSSLKIVLNSEEESKIVEVPVQDFSVLETKSFLISSGDIEIKEIKVIPIFGDKEGTEAKKDISEKTKIDGLIGFWKFEGNAEDFSGEGNHGTNHGAAFVDGKVGKSASFDGVDDYIDCGHAGGIFAPTSSPKTMAAWVKTSYAEGGDNPMGYSGNSWYDGYWDIYFRESLYFRVGGSDDGTGAGAFKYSGSIPFEADQWYHVVGTWNPDENFVKVYINGVEIETTSTSTSLIKDHPWTDDETHELVIGRFGNVNADTGGHNYLPGLVDEVLIFNRVLSKDEIKSLYESQK